MAALASASRPARTNDERPPLCAPLCAPCAHRAGARVLQLAEQHQLKVRHERVLAKHSELARQKLAQAHARLDQLQQMHSLHKEQHESHHKQLAAALTQKQHALAQKHEAHATLQAKLAEKHSAHAQAEAKAGAADRLSRKYARRVRQLEQVAATALFSGGTAALTAVRREVGEGDDGKMLQRLRKVHEQQQAQYLHDASSSEAGTSRAGPL